MDRYWINFRFAYSQRSNYRFIVFGNSYPKEERKNLIWYLIKGIEVDLWRFCFHFNISKDTFIDIEIKKND